MAFFKQLASTWTHPAALPHCYYRTTAARSSPACLLDEGHGHSGALPEPGNDGARLQETKIPGKGDAVLALSRARVKLARTMEDGSLQDHDLRHGIICDMVFSWLYHKGSIVIRLHIMTLKWRKFGCIKIGRYIFSTFVVNTYWYDRKRRRMDKN